MPTFSYSGDPTTSARDRLRFLVSDVAAPWQLSDEEVTGAYTLAPGIYSAAADLADALAARAAQDGSVGLGTVSIGGGSAARYYLDLAATYRGRAVLAGEGSPGTTAGAAGLGAPAASGLSLGDMTANDRNPDRPASVFSTSRRYPYRHDRGGW